MIRFALTIEFDGRPFMGWQRQKHGPSVQQAIEEAIHRITGETIAVHGAGRTDAGVHAMAMRAHVDVEKVMKPFRLMEAINAQLRPAPISILDCVEVSTEWHARFSCIGRSYEYKIMNRRAPLTWDKGLSWQIPKALDSDAMHEAAQILVGQHDFTTFRSVYCQSESAVKTLDLLRVSRHGEEIIIEAAARSFLHHQVRSMVGCLAMVGEGKWTADDMEDALLAADRTALGYNAPPDGLFFVAATYPA